MCQAGSLPPSEAHLFMGCHNEVSPLLYGLGRADLSVGDVGGDEADKSLHQDLGSIVHIVLLRGQLGQILLLQEETREHGERQQGRRVRQSTDRQAGQNAEKKSQGRRQRRERTKRWRDRTSTREIPS